MKQKWIIFSALLLAGACGASASPIWVVDTLDASVHSSSISLAIDSTDCLHASFRDGDAQLLKYGTLVSGAWTTEVIPDGGNWSCIAVTPLGDPTVSFSFADRLRFARRSGGSWTTELVDPVHGSGYVISHGLDSEGHAHISSYDGGLSIYYATDEGDLWSVEALCSGNAPDGGSIAVGSDDDPRAAYPKYRMYAEEDALVHARRENSLWQRETADTTRYFHTAIEMTLDALNLPSIGYTRVRYWIDTGAYSVEYTRKTTAGVWELSILDGIGHDPLYDNNYVGIEDLALDHAGVPHIIYRKHIHNWGSGEEPRDTLFHACQQGGSWIKEVILASPTSEASLVIDSEDMIEVLFAGPSPHYGLYLARRYDATGTAETPRRPSGLRLSVAPNPSRDGRGTISFGMPGSGPGDLSVYDIRGRLVRSMRAVGPSGAVLWNGADGVGRAVAPGVYFVRLSEGRLSETKRVTIVR